VGAEADFDTAVQYDVATRFRLGVAFPVSSRSFANDKTATLYFAVGAAF
jgi:hypothetical protein